MLEIIKAPAAHVVALSFDGKLTEEEFDVVVAQIDSVLQEHERINLYCDLSKLSGITPKALLKDFLYSISSLGRMYRFQRMATVTDNANLEKLIKFEDRIFSDVEIKSFPSSEKDAALAWSEAKIELPPPGFALSEVEEENFVRIEVGEEVTGYDMRRLDRLIRERYERLGPVNLMAVVGKSPRLGPGLLYEKLKAMDILSCVARYAVVAPPWAKLRVAALGAVINARLHYFPEGQEAAALAWLTDATPTVQLLTSERPSLVALRLVGKVTDREVKSLYQLLLPHLSEENGTDVFIESPFHEGFSLKGLFEAMKLGVKHFSEVTKGVRRLALVTDSRWLSKAVDLENLLLPGIEERPFTFAQRAIALSWLSEGRENDQKLLPAETTSGRVGP